MAKHEFAAFESLVAQVREANVSRSTDVEGDFIGAVLYTPAATQTPTTYQVRKLPELSIDRAIREMAQRVA